MNNTCSSDTGEGEAAPPLGTDHLSLLLFSILFSVFTFFLADGCRMDDRCSSDNEKLIELLKRLLSYGKPAHERR
jgi:hypothetical protein